MLIAGGVTGMLLLLGFIVVRLLTSALFSLLLLLLLPGMVLVARPRAIPDGRRSDGGRRSCWVRSSRSCSSRSCSGPCSPSGRSWGPSRGWGGGRSGFLVPCFWWSAYVRRHTILALAGGTARAGAHTDRPLARRLREGMEPPRQVLLALRGARERRLPAPQGQRHGAARLMRSRGSRTRLAALAIDRPRASGEAPSSDPTRGARPLHWQPRGRDEPTDNRRVQLARRRNATS